MSLSTHFSIASSSPPSYYSCYFPTPHHPSQTDWFANPVQPHLITKRNDQLLQVTFLRPLRGCSVLYEDHFSGVYLSSSLLTVARQPSIYTLPSKMLQPPMLSSPLKQTSEIDWIQPLKNYIRQTYGDDPERYSEECATLNRLRQDMRGAGKDSASGRDLLYRYYGQLELLDLRFPVDENHIKISFTWYVVFYPL